jgi:2,4-dienoyl-CoA reductase-like NADH-dependent reductase (Old Yellow Enzyme family)
MYPKLFERGKIGRLEIGNRIVKAATGTYLSNPDNSVTDRQVRFYEEVARGGAGLVFVDNATAVKEYHMGVCAASDEYIPGLSQLAAAVTDNGAKSGLQLAHPGRDGVFVGGAGVKAASRMQWEPWYQFGFAVPQELSIEEIHELVNAFGNAARRAKQAGFDLVEMLLPPGPFPPISSRRRRTGVTTCTAAPFTTHEIPARDRQGYQEEGGPRLSTECEADGIDYEPGGIVLGKA